MRSGLHLNTQYTAKDGTCQVVLRVHSGKNRRFIRTGVSIPPDHWDHKRLRVNMKSRRHAELNRKLQAIEAAAEQAILADRKLTIPGLIAKLDGGPEPLHGTFADMARQMIQRDPPAAWHTQKTWNSIISKMDRLVPGLTIDDIGPQSMKRYMRACIDDGNDPATPSNNIRQIRAMYRRLCKELGRVPVVVTDGVKLIESNTPPKYVPLNRIPDVLSYVPRDRDRLAHDLWITSFECCGLRYMDKGLLTWTEVRDGWLNLEQHKTAHAKQVKLTARAKGILDRYAGGKYVFKVCGDREATDKELSTALVTINASLRRIGKELGLPHPLTTHTARHTWTEWALSQNMPLPNIKRLLGLKSWKAFEAYIARFNPAVAADASSNMEQAFP